MYIIPEMIDMGLEEGQEFPSKAHKAVAEIIALCNPNVFQRDVLTAVVQAVCKVPMEEIVTVKYPTLVDRYGCPDVGMYR